VCMPVSIRIVFKLLCFCSMFLLQADHVTNEIVYIDVINVCDYTNCSYTYMCINEIS